MPRLKCRWRRKIHHQCDFDIGFQRTIEIDPQICLRSNGLCPVQISKTRPEHTARGFTIRILNDPPDVQPPVLFAEQKVTAQEGDKIWTCLDHSLIYILFLGTLLRIFLSLLTTKQSQYIYSFVVNVTANSIRISQKALKPNCQKVFVSFLLSHFHMQYLKLGNVFLSAKLSIHW